MQHVLARIEAAVLGTPLRVAQVDLQAILGLDTCDRMADEQPVWKDRRFPSAGTLRLASTHGAVGIDAGGV